MKEVLAFIMIMSLLAAIYIAAIALTLFDSFHKWRYREPRKTNKE